MWVGRQCVCVCVCVCNYVVYVGGRREGGGSLYCNFIGTSMAVESTSELDSDDDDFSMDKVLTCYIS